MSNLYQNNLNRFLMFTFLGVIATTPFIGVSAVLAWVVAFRMLMLREPRQLKQSEKPCCPTSGKKG